jgi:hypothetical protein
LGAVLDIPDTNVLRPAKLLPDNYPQTTPLEAVGLRE